MRELSQENKEIKQTNKQKKERKTNLSFPFANFKNISSLKYSSPIISIIFSLFKGISSFSNPSFNFSLTFPIFQKTEKIKLKKIKNKN